MIIGSDKSISFRSSATAESSAIALPPSPRRASPRALPIIEAAIPAACAQSLDALAIRMDGAAKVGCAHPP